MTEVVVQHGPIKRSHGRIAMGFTGLVSSRLYYAAAHSTKGFPGISLNANLDANGEERLAERTRIAQELHDTLLQGFLGVAMQLREAVDHLPADSTAKPRFNHLMRVMERALEEGRRAVRVCVLRTSAFPPWGRPSRAFRAIWATPRPVFE